jgi:hypothetical protein
MVGGMEVDDLDNLIADSLSGVQSAQEADRSQTAPVVRSAGEAVRELRQVPKSDGVDGDDAPNEELFTNLVNTLQDDGFQKAMAEALRGTGGGAGEIAAAPVATASDDNGVEDFLKSFMKSFDTAVGSDANFDKEITSMMTSMLSNDLICEPLQQIADNLEPWLKSQKSLSAADKNRYEEQLRLYKKIISVYKDSPDPLPESAREEVQRLLADLHGLGQPPEEVMKQITPKETEEGGESFEDFMKSMGLDQGLGTAEQDLLKKLTEDPEELTKAMKEMADGMGSDECKQQ